MSNDSIHSVAANPSTVEFDPDYDGPPLNQSTTFRLSKPMLANITIRALVEQSNTSAIIRRWIRAGAKAEGFDLDSPQ